MLAHFDYSHPRKGLSTHICKLVLYCHLPAKKKRPAGGGAQASLAYRVPVTVRVLEPGAVVQTPVAASCVYVAAGTVTFPATVAKRPVVAS